MIATLKGRVELIDADSIVLDVSGVGYELYVSNPSKFIMNTEVLVYTYLKISENDFSLFGFLFKEEKNLFLKLISVKGIGPKSAMSMLSNCDYSTLITAIEVGNLNYLKKLPGIGPKAAQQIILDLKGHLQTTSTKDIKERPNFKEAKEALKTFGFKVSEIDNALSKINDDNLQTNEIVFEALQILNTK